jgi:hypothetical protein
MYVRFSFSWPVDSGYINAGIMCLCASVVLPESCSDLLDFAGYGFLLTKVALHKTQISEHCEGAKSYTPNPRGHPRAKEQGGKQSKIEQVLAKFGKKTISLITRLLRSNEVSALMLNRMGM